MQRNILRSCTREKAVWCFISIELHQDNGFLTHVTIVLWALHMDTKPLLLPSVELLSNPQWQDMEHPKEWQDIYSAALDCDLLFDKCLAQIVDPGTISLLGEAAVTQGQLARDLHARFQAWSSNLGVFAEQNLCLDRRLSSSKDIQAMVINRLDNLFLNLQHCESLSELQTCIAANLRPSCTNNPEKRR